MTLRSEHRRRSAIERFGKCARLGRLRGSGRCPCFDVPLLGQPEDERIVPPFVLQNLEDRIGYAICPGKITAIEMPIVTMPDRDVRRERMIPPMLRQSGTPLPKPEPVAVTVPSGRPISDERNGQR